MCCKVENGADEGIAQKEIQSYPIATDEVG